MEKHETKNGNYHHLWQMVQEQVPEPAQPATPTRVSRPRRPWYARMTLSSLPFLSLPWPSLRAKDRESSSLFIFPLFFSSWIWGQCWFAFYKVMVREQERGQVIRKVKVGCGVVGPTMCTAVQARYSSQPVNKMPMYKVYFNSKTLVTDKSWNRSTRHELLSITLLEHVRIYQLFMFMG
jgi:hypothetical protein